MINIREFRIGNLLIEKNSGQIIEVINISQKRISFSGQFKAGWQAEPIPLTEEWYLKSGFEIVSDYHPEGKTYKLGELSCSEFYNYVSYKNIRITRHEVKYFHNLQNLYFALKGEELKLNDK